MNFIKKSILIILVPLFFSFNARAEVNVVTTIKPLHSLISSVMEGVGKPSLIIEGTNNPHTFVFKPSHAEMIENADIISAMSVEGTMGSDIPFSKELNDLRPYNGALIVSDI